MPMLSPRDKMRAMLTPPLSTKANPGNARRRSTTLTTKSKQLKSNNECTPKTPYQRTQPTPRPQWSLPRTHYTFADSPSASNSEASDFDDDDVENESCFYGDNPSGVVPLGSTDSGNKENMSFQHVSNIQQQTITKPKLTDQSLKQPIVSVADTAREKQQAQKCYDSAMEIMGSDTFSANSCGSETPNNWATSGDGPGMNRSIDDLNRVCEAAPEFIDTASMIPSAGDNNEGHTPSASTQEENEPGHSSKVVVAQSPNEEITTFSHYNCEDTLSPLPQRELVVRSPIPSLANNFEPSEASSAAASSVVTDLFAALRTSCSTICGGENDDHINAANHLSPIHPRKACLTAERKRWIQKTLLDKREYTPYQTKEREECCKNKDSHELTTERKRWIEETLLAQAKDTLKKMSPKTPNMYHQAFLTTTLAAASNELLVQRKLPAEEDDARDESTVMSIESPQQSHQLDNSFLASALVATNMLLTPPRREMYSSKPSRPRMSIGATPLPLAKPFSPSSAASSAFTETASNIILHAMKQLTPKLSASTKQGEQKQKNITPSRKSDLLSIVAEMDYLDTVGSRGSKDKPSSQCDQTKLVERVEKLEHLITSQYSRGLENHRDEINELRRELHRSKHQLENERQLVEEANQRASMLMSNLKASQEVHSNVERQLREKIQSLEVEVDCLRDSQQKFASDHAEATNKVEPKVASSLADKDTEIDELRRANSELLERQRIADVNHRECTKDNENLRSQLLALTNERSEKELYLSTALDNLRSVSESFSCINQKLEQEVNARKDDVTCLQRSLELMSCELIESTNEVKDLRSENARLHDELQRMRAGKKWPFSYNRM
jgi:hypothetical protein